jgi:arylsulfatase A-like enzyme
MNSPSRRSFLKTVGAGMAAVSVAGLSACSQKQPPNVILIIGDDISWNDFGCYGHPTIRTPNVDKMAADGIRFTNTFLTASSCSPSRCSIIAGRYPHNTGAAELHTPLPADQIPFPLRLKEHGYYCAQAGKWHMGDAPRRAFDDVMDKWDGQADPGAEGGWLPLLQNRPLDKPFFMWFASIDAHRNWDEKIFLNRHDPAQAVVPKYFADAPGTREDLSNYYDEIARLDFYVGEIEEELNKQGIAEKTIIIFMADNGRPFPRCKTRVYDSGMKTPFVIKWPNGIKKPAVCESLVSAIDIAPTILDVCGVPIDDSFQGQSFAGLFKNPGKPFRNYVFSEHNWHDHEALERMLRSDDFLYVLNERPHFPNCGPADSNNGLSQKDLNELRDNGELSAEQNDVFLAPRPTEELFDLKNDPEQFHNVADDPTYAEVLADMRQVMARWRDETADTSPEHITPDWYTRFYGQPLDIERVRGDMPGAAKNATAIKASGPF